MRLTCMVVANVMQTLELHYYGMVVSSTQYTVRSRIWSP
jgi:hypothetical protein